MSCSSPALPTFASIPPPPNFIQSLPTSSDPSSSKPFKDPFNTLKSPSFRQLSAQSNSREAGEVDDDLNRFALQRSRRSASSFGAAMGQKKEAYTGHPKAPAGEDEVDKSPYWNPEKETRYHNSRQSYSLPRSFFPEASTSTIPSFLTKPKRFAPIYDVPTPEEALLLSLSTSPSSTTIDPSSSSAQDKRPQPHPLTMNPSSNSAWDFDRLFRLAGGLKRVEVEENAEVAIEVRNTRLREVAMERLKALGNHLGFLGTGEERR